MIRKSGWYNESWRHSLARKGVQTKSTYLANKNYFQNQEPEQVKSPTPADQKIVQKFTKALEENTKFKKLESEEKGGSEPTVTDRTQLDRLKETQKLQEETSKAAKIQEGASRVKDLLNDKDVIGAAQELDLIKDKDARKRAKAIFDAEVLKLVQEGQDVPLEVRQKLSFRARQEVTKLREKDTFRGAVKGASKEAVFDAAESVVDKFESASARGDEKIKESKEALEAEVRAREEGREDVFKSNPIKLGKTNIFLGDGDEKPFSKKGDGVFNFYPEEIKNAPIKPLSDSVISSDVKFTGPTFGMENKLSPDMAKQETFSKQIDDLFNSRKTLGDVDLRPYNKGLNAFKKGDREKLIEAINEQEFQHKQQESRWKHSEDMRTIVDSSEFRNYVLDEKGGPFSGLNVLFGGGKELADKTEKVAKIQTSIKQGADKAKARSEMLRNKLIIMDNAVLPDDSRPRSSVKVLNSSEKGFDSMGFFNEVADETGEFFFN